MERAIIQGIKRLRVLTPYDYDNMDELVQDLSNALEESAFTRASPNKTAVITAPSGKKTHRSAASSWKRRSKSASSLVTLGSSLPKSTVSEDSESSLDGRTRWRIESSQPQSDSDDVIVTVPSPLSSSKHHQYQQLTAWRHAQQPVESDSVNENFLPSSQQHRRKRKFKRMAVDIPSEAGNGGGTIAPDINLAIQKSRPVKSAKPFKITTAKSFQQCSNENRDSLCGRTTFFEINTSKLSGKRKRSMRERSVECITYEDGSGFSIDRRFLVASGHFPPSSSEWANENNMMDYANGDSKGHIEASSSSLSSSESDGGIITNDEGREGDDEHSDFFHEPGHSPGWWEDEADITDKLDAKFQAILTGSFQYVASSSSVAREAYRTRLKHLSLKSGREIRAGRRRLGRTAAVIPMVSLVNDKVSKMVLEASKAQRLDAGAKLGVGDIKRRRRTPPVGPVTQGNPGSIEPLPSDPLRPLSSSEWDTVMMETSSCNAHSTPSPLSVLVRQSKSTFPPPPPPPPSPQPCGGPAGDDVTSLNDGISNAFTDITAALISLDFSSVVIPGHSASEQQPF